MPTKNDGSVVSFPIYLNEQPALKRSNERHDLLLQLIDTNRIELCNFVGRAGVGALKEKHRLSEKGLKGPSPFRQLSRFDVGYSFLVDSLHNIHLGLFVSETNLQSLVSYKYSSIAYILETAFDAMAWLGRERRALVCPQKNRRVVESSTKNSISLYDNTSSSTANEV